MNVVVSGASDPYLALLNDCVTPLHWCWRNLAELSMGVSLQTCLPQKWPYRSVPGKRPCTTFQGATVAASIQMYGILILGKRSCGPKSRVMFKRTYLGHYSIRPSSEHSISRIKSKILTSITDVEDIPNWTKVCSETKSSIPDYCSTSTGELWTRRYWTVHRPTSTRSQIETIVTWETLEFESLKERCGESDLSFCVILTLEYKKCCWYVHCDDIKLYVLSIH